MCKAEFRVSVLVALVRDGEKDMSQNTQQHSVDDHPTFMSNSDSSLYTILLFHAKGNESLGL